MKPGAAGTLDCPDPSLGSPWRWGWTWPTRECTFSIANEFHASTALPINKANFTWHRGVQVRDNDVWHTYILGSPEAHGALMFLRSIDSPLIIPAVAESTSLPRHLPTSQRGAGSSPCLTDGSAFPNSVTPSALTPDVFSRGVFSLLSFSIIPLYPVGAPAEQRGGHDYQRPFSTPLSPVGAEDRLVQDPTMASQVPRTQVTRPTAGAGKTLRSCFTSSDAGVPLPPGTRPLTARVNSEPKSL